MGGIPTVRPLQEEGDMGQQTAVAASVATLLDRRKEWPDGTVPKYLNPLFDQECVKGRISGPATEGACEGSGPGKQLC